MNASDRTRWYGDDLEAAVLRVGKRKQVAYRLFIVKAHVVTNRHGAQERIAMLISFFGEQCLKDAVVERVREHQRLDQIIQGTYWDGSRGCAIGCVLHSYDHMAYESQLGLPVFLAYMDEDIFESLPPKEAVLWPLRFIQAVPVGVDLELVFPRFMHWMLSDPDGMRKHANAQTLPIIDTLVTMYAMRIEGIQFDAASAARSAASAARAARAARAASAASAAWAERSAESAAWAAWAERSAESAASAASASWAASAESIHRHADMLISILHSYESTPVLVYAPCEERAVTFHG